MAKRKKVAAKKSFKKRKTVKTRHSQFPALDKLNENLEYLEGQALKAYECVQAIRKRSTPEWKKWIDGLSSQDWAALANAQRERISTEIKNLSNDILSKINCADILTGKDSILKDAKESLEGIVNRVDHGALAQKAIDTAIHTKDGLLAFLNIPTHNEMTQLQRKLKRLERQMHQMSE